MKTVLSIIIFVGIILLKLNLFSEELGIPTPQNLEAQFKAAQNENQRYQVLDDIGKSINLIAENSEAKTYLKVINELVIYSKLQNDADWVGRKGTQIIQQVSEVKVQSILKISGPIINDKELQQDFLFYFVNVTEAFQFSYLSQTLRTALLPITDLNLIENAFLFFEKIELTIVNPVDYIQRELVSLKSTAAFLFCRDFRNISASVLNIWISRLNSDGMQRLLNEIESQILTSQSTDQIAIENSLSVTKSLYALIFERYKNDYLNDWQYIRALKILSAGVLKFEEMDWSIDQKNLNFIIQHFTPVSFVSFCNEFGNLSLQRVVISRKSALLLMPSYNLLKQTLVEKKYGYEASTFNSGYLKIKKAAYTDYEIEGSYKITHPDYSQLIIAFKNRTEIVAGLQTPRETINIAFDHFQFDDASGNYISSSLMGATQFVLKFKFGADKKISGCLNTVCFIGTKTFSFPNYLNLLDSGKSLTVPGFYRGQIKYENGSIENAELFVSSISGTLIGNLKFYRNKSLKLDLAFDMGLFDNKDGVLYLASRVNSVPTIHIFRGYLKDSKTLTGVWFTTSKVKLGKFNLIKVY